MRVILPGGKTTEAPGGRPALEIAESAKLAGRVVCARVDGRLAHLSEVVSGEQVELVLADSDEGLAVLRHSAAHVMADAVCQVFPGAKLGFGPSLKETFYYDIQLPAGTSLTEEDLSRIEERMAAIVAEDSPFVREEVSHADALRLMEGLDQEFKCDALRTNLRDEAKVTLYRHGNGRFTDLCRGPHVPSTGFIKAFKLLNLAGAYWKGREGNPQLQRLYGTAWRSEKDLRVFIQRREEAAKRDHRKIGRQMGLFTFHDEGPGFPFWHPRGRTIFNELQGFLRGLYLQYGYQEVRAPIVLHQSLWKRSGHYENYRENMYFTRIDDDDYCIKPMNCPGHCLMFSAEPRSYRDLPLRFAEFGLVHRHEKSGVLHGLFRVRSFTQDDAHIFCTEDHLAHELVAVIEMVRKTYGVMGFQKVRVELSTRPEKSIGSLAIWEKATSALEHALRESGLEYKVNPGDGAFYGPKIDFHIRDCMDRSWQCGTVQLDFSMPAPERLNLSYRGEDNQMHVPVMIHRAILGSFERFIGILCEHHAGAFPLWLAPEQVRVLTITSDQDAYAVRVKEALAAHGLRAAADLRGDKINKKVREAALDKVPYALIVGAREAESETVALRPRGADANEGVFPLAQVVSRLAKERDERLAPFSGETGFSADEAAEAFQI